MRFNTSRIIGRKNPAYPTYPRLLRPAQLERLRMLATLPGPEPLGGFDEPGVEALLADLGIEP